MTTAYEIPFDPRSQTFLIALADKTYRLSTKWCRGLSAWVLDVATPEGEEILSGVPLITGSDILAQQAHLGLGGKIFVQSAGDASVVPTFSELGRSGRVFFVTEP